MSRYRSFFSILGFLFLAEIVIAGGLQGKAGEGRKQLPLDAIPGIVMKSRENSVYQKGRVIIKLMPDAAIRDIEHAALSISFTRIEPMFPRQMVDRNISDVDLSRFFVAHFTEPVDAFTVAEELQMLAGVQYAEPSFMHPLESVPPFNPNDPSFPSQYGLTRIQAPQAWDLTQGDTSVVIGIVDSGVEVNHPDLSPNIWLNRGETGLDGLGNDKRTNGIDDDANGYIDDWRGWDFGGSDFNNVVGDNNPSPVGANTEHGTHVAGIASAATNNSIGIAGTGFKCRLLAIKTSSDNDTRGPGGTAYIIAGYEGIAYAAFMGARVANCSWGSTGGSQTEQDLINYATQQGCLIVAAAGNSNSSAAHYPSGYANVISVAATNSSDVKASFSNYGSTVDVCAPGVSILSTIYPGSYTSSYSGTSMSSPFAAGTAGLVKAYFPAYTSLQVGEKVRMTADNIDGVNPSFVGQLGRGRINAFKALTQNIPSVRALRFVVRDSLGGNNNGVPEPNETIDIYVTFINYLSPTTNASVTMTVTGAGLTVLNGTFNVGVLGTMDTVRNSASPFRIQIAGSVAPGLIATVRLAMTDGAYADNQQFAVVVNPTFQTHNINQVTVTMTSNGRIGFNDYSSNTQGVGFIYPSGGANLLYEGGLLIGTSTTKIVNNIRTTGQTTQDNDFLARELYQLQTPGVISNQDGSTVYSDSSAPTTNRIGLRVRQYSYGFTAEEHDDYLIVRYDIQNLTGSTIANIYAGQYYDWDVANYASNRTGYDASRSLLYCWDGSTPAAPYAGMRALDSAISARGLVNTGTLSLTRASKFGWLNGGTGAATAGPGDMLAVITSRPFDLAAGATRTVGFAAIGGANLAAVQANADAAKAKWQEILSMVSVGSTAGTIPESFSLSHNYPNPFNPSTVITFRVPKAERVRIKVFDLLGREIATLVDERRDAGAYTVTFDGAALASGVYLYQMVAGGFVKTEKMLLQK